ncbi:hypothetical protein COCCU_01620 [Corynebacterium occultum]|uniref:DUF4244 domain-containing protein n=1 Tax=Corynebacterium occultum TaxID=2675219 RepID=A0A6B8VY70_9CORY|nr:DUF4244 domain-containing protein [Corynebacterium occultum]QGU06284.1 hypothetical protein COCCU_01620 [Corynebacterium occultum]
MSIQKLQQSTSSRLKIADLKARTHRIMANEEGMSTVEYAMGSLAAAALAAVLYAVINGGGVVDAIEAIITDALTSTP